MYHHSIRNSGCAPWSAGKANVLPGTTDANPSACCPSPAKPCARAALPPNPTTKALATRARRDMKTLSLIGEYLDQARRLHTRKFENRNQSSQQRGQHRNTQKLQQFDGKDM